jgi:hypothetical protein
MRITRNVLFALLLLGVPLAASAQLSVGAGASVGPRGHASVDVGFFYDQLAPYGNWIERPNYGWVWTPRNVSASWRPYQAGHWVWSDEGWTWLTDEPYGWATYHYGRWYQDPELGWAWVPGSDWAPAWVSWQEGDGNVGWAPLPPGANVNASYDGGPAGPGYDDGPAYDDGAGSDDGPAYDEGPGYDDGPVYDEGPGYDDNYRYDSSYAYGGGYYGGYAYGIAPSAYLFVPVSSFLAVDLFDFYLPWVRVSAFWGHTRNCTFYGYRGGHYFNRGVPFDHVRRYYHNIPRYQLSELGGFRGHGYRVEGNRVAFFRPQVQRTRGITPLQRPAARGSVMRAEQFRSAFPDRVARAQREVGANRQAFRGQVQGAAPGRQAWQQDRSGRQQRIDYGQRAPRGQVDAYRNQVERQRQYDTLRRNREQVYSQRRLDDRNRETPAYRQRQYETQRRNQEQVYRQRQYDSPQRWQPRSQNDRPRQQYSAPRVQERSYRQERSYSAPRQSAPRREYRAPSSRSGGGNSGHRRGHGG